MSAPPRRGVILAAGRGTRLGELTHHLPKPMVPVAGRPLLEHILLRLRQATPLRDFTVVVQYRAESIIRHFGDGSALGLNIHYVHQPEHQPGTAGALRTALENLPAEPVLMSFGDILTDPTNYQRLLHAHRADLTAVLGVNWLPDVSEGGGVWLDGDRVLRVQEKPRHADTHWNLAGVHLFAPSILPVLQNLAPSARGEYELTDAVQTLLQQQPHAVRAVRFEGYWNDVGTPERLRQAEAYLAGLPPEKGES
ncbi:MAG: sugar phosphate nucleotidyltransferase [Armatimonadota bacterium]|nr:sugar phosphate nucleotidyltransferase [Armatimonadota bacterium]